MPSESCLSGRANSLAAQQEWLYRWAAHTVKRRRGESVGRRAGRLAGAERVSNDGPPSQPAVCQLATCRQPACQPIVRLSASIGSAAPNDATTTTTTATTTARAMPLAPQSKALLGGPSTGGLAPLKPAPSSLSLARRHLARSARCKFCIKGARRALGSPARQLSCLAASQPVLTARLSD